MRHPLPRSLRGRLILVALIALVPLVGFSAYSYRQLDRMAAGEWESTVVHGAERTADEYRRVVDETRSLLSILARIPAIRSGDASACQALVERFMEELPLHSALGVVDSDGYARCIAPADDDAVDLRDRDYIRRAFATGEVQFSGFQVGRVTGNPVMSVAHPIHGDDGTVVRVIATGAELDLLTISPLGEGGPGGVTVTVLDAEGRVLARSPPAAHLLGSRVSWALPAAGAGTGPDSLLRAEDLDGESRVFAVRPLLLSPGRSASSQAASEGWVAVGFDPRSTRAGVASFLREHLVVLAGAGLALVLGIGGVLEFAFVRRLQPVVRAARRLGEGDLAARTGMEGGEDELGVLARTFDRMAARLHEREERKEARARERIREREALLQQLAESVDEVFWIFDPYREELLYASPAYEEVYGRSLESLREDPTSWMLAIHPEDRDEVMRDVMEHGERPYESEYRVVHPDRTVRWIRHRTFPVRNDEGAITRVAGVARDVTDRRRLEAALHQSGKLEAVGRLAGGVAHDFNNVLTAIRGHTQLLLESVEPGDPIRKDLEEIDAAAERAASLTGQLLAFSRKQPLDPRVIDVNDVIRGLEPMLRRLLGEDVHLVTELEAGLGTIRADPNQLEQVLVNLAVNARDAMPEGGVLVIVTGNVSISLPHVEEERRIVPPGEYVRIRVSDTGEGMDPEVRDHAFEPFFTTKDTGKGTGLGLASVYGIVKQSDGFIWVSSEPGKGATFEIDFPRVDRTPEIAGSSGVEGEDDAARGTETVLIVEDEDAVLSVACRSLEKHGYRVRPARSAREARELFGECGEEIDLLLADVVMPAGRGPELAAELRDRRPDLPVLYMSGYPAVAGQKPESPAGEDGADFIEKPFGPQALARKVREVLDANGR